MSLADLARVTGVAPDHLRARLSPGAISQGLVQRGALLAASDAFARSKTAGVGALHERMQSAAGRPATTSPSSAIAIQARAYGGMIVDITSRPYDLVCDILNLSEADIDRLRGQTVLSIGEGASNFAKTLEVKGVTAIAYDRWYGLNDTERAKLRFHGGDKGVDPKKLLSLDEVRANASTLQVDGDADSLPFADKSLGGVYAANIVYWLLDGEDTRGLSLIDESVRACAPYRELRFNADPDCRPKLDAYLTYRPDVSVEWHDYVATVTRLI